MIMDSSLSRGNFVILTPLTNWEQTGSAAAKNSRFTIYIMIIMMVTIISTSFESLSERGRQAGEIPLAR